MKRAAAVVFALGMLLTVSVAAEAGPITINIGHPSGGTGVLHAPGTLADGLNVYLGSVLITGDLGTFESYCVDLLHFDVLGANLVTLGSMSDWNNTATPVHSNLGGGAASWLYNQYAAGATQSSRAALSLAIWNSLYDNDYTVAGGSGFWVTSLSNTTYSALANDMLGALKSNSDPLPNNMWLRTQDSGTNYAQDFIGPTPVPEPATIFLLGTGLAAAAGFRRRRARKGDSL
jgi:PEP-CTERM motif-containing protein